MKRKAKGIRKTPNTNTKQVMASILIEIDFQIPCKLLLHGKQISKQI